MMRFRNRPSLIGGSLALAALLLGLGSCALPSAPADRYAIVIGIADYPPLGDWTGSSPQHNDLSYTVNDANDMATELSQTGWTIKDSLLDGYATKAGIQAAISSLSGLVGSNSSVLVYYSGHGDLSSDGSTAYIIPDDGIDASQNELVSNWISPAEIDAWLKALPCKNKVLILDSCFSGGFVTGGAAVDAAPQNYGPYDGGTTASALSTALANGSRLFSKAFSSASDPDILTISAAGSEEFSYDDGGSSHGAFTNWLLKAASDRSADSDGNHLVTATEALAYASENLQANWNASYYYYLGGADPVTGNPIYADFLPHISGGSGDIVLYDKR